MDRTDFKKILASSWTLSVNGSKMFQLGKNLKHLKENVRGLNSVLASYAQKHQQASQQLDITLAKMRSAPLAQTLIDTEKRLLADIRLWSNVEEQAPRKKSRALWITCGDSNSKYFHAQCKIRSSRNNITSVYDDMGKKIIEPHLVEKESGKILKTFSVTAVTLVQKFANPTLVKDYRPIACYTTMYKIIKKVLTNRIKEVIGTIVSPSQTVFIKGFPQKFMDWITVCVTSVSYSLVLNGGLTAPFQASGLQANIDKSSIYMSGVQPQLKQEILATLGFCEGTLPFTYLVVPLSSKKLTTAQCMPLVKKTSFYQVSGVCPSDILAQIFLLPKRIMKLINSICRSYLWTGDATISKKALVSWVKTCLLRAAGELNIMNLCLWNKATIVKQLWALSEKKDCFWIRWVHIYYMKNETVEECAIPSYATWVVKKIIEARKFELDAPAL
ncbi:uncharacterized protein LOC132630831 [Lycium barbarum]|uniref:uncharacterized protein LOC132630831 n=1 Tax=Lycium barbarum TaxID=112863 RepID=UPI00293E4515|nr:uncharacterized protein LOC132630831 [Lycium barbarum]